MQPLLYPQLIEKQKQLFVFVIQFFFRNLQAYKIGFL